MIAIIGGGISGLALGRELAALGADFVVLEADNQVGGVIRSGRVEGRLLDWGPQRARLTRPFAALVDELGLRDQLVIAPPGLDLFVYRGGRLRRVPFSAAAFLGSDVVGPAAKLRALLEPLTAGPDPQESVARYFTRKLGLELYETLVGPLYGGLYGSDPADMRVGLSRQHVLEEFGVGRSLVLHLLGRGGAVKPPPACSFAGGMQTLPDALARALAPRVRVATPVLELRPNGSGWAVETQTETLDASRVVIATPAAAAARLLQPLADAAAGRIQRLRYNPLGVVHLHAETKLRGMGFQVSFAEPLALRGVTYNDSLFGRAGVYTAYLGGGARPDVVELDDEALARLAVQEFRACTGYDSRPLAVAREAMPAWDHTWSALAGLQLPPGIALTANWESRPGLPGRFARARALAQELTAGRAS
jgi:oxygen-dependent protoporphyrinogen oxidase